jgi:hypothetical protein
MGVVATSAVPSSSNLQGGLAGLATTLIMGALTHAGYLAIVASALGLPEATLAVAATGVIGVLAKVAVTHISELKNADAILNSLQSIKITQEYPGETPSSTPNNLSNGS